MSNDSSNQPLTNRGKTTTVLLLAVGFTIWVLWDVIAYSVWGGATTISTTIGSWLAWSLWITLLMGLLAGHLMGSVPEDSTGTGLRFVVLTLGIAIGYLCTVL